MAKLSTAKHPKFWKEQISANAQLAWIVGRIAFFFAILVFVIFYFRLSDNIPDEKWVIQWYTSGILLLILMFIPGWILHRHLLGVKQLKEIEINFWCYVQIIGCGTSLYLFSVISFLNRGTLIPFAAFFIYVNLFFTFKLRPKLFFNLLAFVMLAFCLSYFSISLTRKVAYFVEALGIAIPTFIISFYQYKLKEENFSQRLQLETKNEAITTDNSHLMMQALQTQMNPHFIFNTLNTIQHYLVENDQKSSLNSMAKFAGLIRMIFHFSDKKSIDLENEIKFLQLYMDLEKLRFEDKVTIHFEVDPLLKQEENQSFIPPLLIQPLIENAFKHSLMYLEKEGHLRVKMYLSEKGFLGVEVENNGPNWGEEPSSPFLQDGKGSGQALKLIRERLAVYDKLHPDSCNSTIEIIPSDAYPSGSLIRLELPFAKG